MACGQTSRGDKSSTAWVECDSIVDDCRAGLAEHARDPFAIGGAEAE